MFCVSTVVNGIKKIVDTYSLAALLLSFFSEITKIIEILGNIKYVLQEFTSHSIQLYLHIKTPEGYSDHR